MQSFPGKSESHTSKIGHSIASLTSVKKEDPDPAPELAAPVPDVQDDENIRLSKSKTIAMGSDFAKELKVRRYRIINIRGEKFCIFFVSHRQFKKVPIFLGFFLNGVKWFIKKVAFFRFANLCFLSIRMSIRKIIILQYFSDVQSSVFRQPVGNYLKNSPSIFIITGNGVQKYRSRFE